MYPVDEHSLLCTSRLESLDAPSPGSLKYLSEIMQTVPRKEFLYLALLLHDIGKVKGKYHEAEGYKNIKRITERFLLDPDTREFVEFMVKKHILMSEIASKHDIESPDVIAFFSEQVMTEERLNALYLMTYADMASVSDSFWTPWRDALLRELYIKTRDHIRGVRVNKHELMKDIDEKYGSELDDFIKIMPEDYFISVPVRKIMSDLALYKESIQEGFSLHVENLQDGTTEITLSMKDREGLFSDMVSVFAVRRLNIIDARLFTTSTGWVLDRVRISNWNDLWWDGMEELIENNLKEALLHGRKFALSEQPRKPRGIESFIGVDNENRDDHTLIEVLAPDRPGLLYDITQVFSKNKINIINGRIYTEQGIANDIFHVNADGAQLDAESIIRVLGELWLKVKQ
jgi:[protein-PII] uridylyltransferase